MSGPYLKMQAACLYETLVLVIQTTRRHKPEDRNFKACLVSFYTLAQNCENRLLASSCSSACPSARTEQLGSHWTDFHENCYRLRVGPKLCTSVRTAL